MSCGHQGIYFGEDGICIDGHMWDLDSCDKAGGPLSSGGDIPCPECNHDEWLKNCCENSESNGINDFFEGGPREFPTKKENLLYPQDFEVLQKAWLKGYDEAAREQA